MYYKLLNKNVITAALISLITLGTSGICEAQGVVSLVEEENIVSPQNSTAEATEDSFESFDADTDIELPDTTAQVEETDEIIPFDNDGLISPAPTSEVENQDNVAPVNEGNENSVEESPQLPEETFDEVNQAQEDILPETLPDTIEEVAPQTAQVKESTETAPEVQPMADTGATADIDAFGDEEFNLELGDSVPEVKSVVAKPTPVKQPNVEAVNINNKPLNNAAAASSENKIPQIQPQIDIFANSVLSKIDNDLFSQMSDIEKQTTLLTLELRREKIRSEIEAIKAQRTKAEEEKIAALEEKRRQEFEWKKEQEAKVYREQQALKEKEIELEKLRQRKALNMYMNKMLQEKQKWISENAALLNKIQEVEENRNEIAENFKQKLDSLTTLSNKMIQSANTAKNNHDRTVASLTAQNIQLKKRIEADAAAQNNGEMGASLTEVEEPEIPIDLSQEYAILDIIGKGDDLVAKLINKMGDSFVARKGTVLHSGFVVEEITYKHIRFGRNGSKQYLYTNGTIEPERMENDETLVVGKPKPAPVRKQEPSEPAMGSSRLPSLANGMFVK